MLYDKMAWSNGPTNQQFASRLSAQKGELNDWVMFGLWNVVFTRSFRPYAVCVTNIQRDYEVNFKCAH